ncbi:MAG: hypothetical protein IV106_15590 [Pseudomonas umsongensis]|nr:hypothetical protein [Pseudomonas umsongensis]
MLETTKPNITAIVPLDLVHRPLDIISKARQMATAAKRSNVKVIFAHNDRGMWVDRLFRLVIGKCDAAVIISKRFYTGNVNAALLRNEAFKHVEDGRRQKLSATPYLSGTVLPPCLTPNSALKNAPPFKSVMPKVSVCVGLPA